MSVISYQLDTLIDELRRGERRSLARAMSLVDLGGRRAHRLKDRLRGLTGQVPWWGFTGPPGVGKSALIDALLSRLRERGRRVGVVAVDPSSPLAGGALLGDRVRMMRHAVDRDVFIRSLATHHCEGGLSDGALHCARLLELARYDPVLIETVGAGQNEVDIASVADICVVVLGPGYGDDIQLIKAGLLEIADIVVVNKCDLPGANRLLEEVHAEIGLSSSAGTIQHYGRRGVACFHATKSRVSMSRSRHVYPGCAREGMPRVIVGIEAKSGKGVDQLLEKLLEADRAARGDEQRRHRRHRRVLGEIKRSAMLTYEQALERWLATPAAQETVAKLERGELSLDEVVRRQLPAISSQQSRRRRSIADSSRLKTET